MAEFEGKSGRREDEEKTSSPGNAIKAKEK
jgi:hypothetical protein